MNDMQKAYLEKNILLVFGKVCEETYLYLQEAVGYLCLQCMKDAKVSPPELTLVISTGGGQRSLGITDLLNLYPGKITGLVIGRAHSAGALILQACDTRLATPNSTILIHHGSTGEIPYDDLLSEERLERFVACSKLAIETRYSIYQARSKMTREQIQKLCFEDRTMDVNEAITLGLLDGVWDKPLPITGNGLDWTKED